MRIDEAKYSKRKLLSTAISQMYVIVANDWAASTMYSFDKKHPELVPISKNVKPILDLKVEEELEELYQTLHQYFKRDAETTSEQSSNNSSI